MNNFLKLWNFGLTPPPISLEITELMKTSLSTRLAIICILFFTTAGLASANLLVNGGFETGDFTGWSQAGNTGFTGVDGNPNSGNNAAFLGPVGSTGNLIQGFATVAGAFYDLTFYLSNGGAGGNNPNVNGQPTDFRAVFAGSFVAGGDVSNVGSSYTQFHFLVQATGAFTFLEFVFRNDSSFFFLDDVSVELHQASGVPETASSAMLMGLALVGLFGAQRVFGGRRAVSRTT